MIHKKRLENNLTLRIWSAGCSSGEELYTMAIILSELLPDIDKWNLNFLGTDINVHMLQKALSGRYSEWSMRSISDYYKKKYFLQEGKDYILSEKIKNLAHFNFINLNDYSYPSIFNGTNAQDLILCRNVLIYFSPEAIATLMHKLSLSLAPEGYLMLGASDPIYLENTDLIFSSHSGSLLKKPVFTFQKVESNRKHSMPVSLPVISTYETPLKTFYQDTIQSNKNKLHVQKKLDTPFSKDTIKECLSKAQWEKSLDLILQNEGSGAKKTAFILNAKANALANLGRLEEAVEAFKACFIQDPTNKENYFLYALTLLELNKLDECEQALRQTLFLDHQYVPGHFQLGLLLIKNKKHGAGLKSLKNALYIAQHKDPAALIPGTQGLSYGRFSEILKNEINLHLPKGHSYVD
jgi:chemotaxis protein methyltransferase CheR